ncbi:ComEA family DNA-binding protein [Idiomarina xiamenensis]|uniref:DNA uptake protein n=1 Tax=Idiomarina xiamenensis 10-D-4 TaxID=740709 RepID=K2KWS0_9GAMM|nr:helix-hairpin-helix domain-containing protein [Idiomarina xiamenensis]EKE86939.1 hypothetical protein A10D4_01817 [Idiomarina xiamenensis 10-D-4]
MINKLMIKMATWSTLVMFSLLPLCYAPLSAAQPLFNPSGGGIQSAKEEQDAVAAGEQTININTASANELASQLKGIGLKRAGQIIALREHLGGFKTIEQLQQVRGIGPIFIANNKHRLSL